MPKTTDRPILALDPGLRDLGYALLSGGKLLTASVIPLRQVVPSRRLAAVHEALIRLVRGYRPITLVLESIPNRPLDRLAGLPALGRRLRRLAATSRMRTAMYSARSVRRTVVGDGWAGKKKVAEALSKQFPVLRVHLTHDRKWKEAYWQNMFDAVALAVHHRTVTHPPSRSRNSG